MTYTIDYLKGGSFKVKFTETNSIAFSLIRSHLVGRLETKTVRESQNEREKTRTLYVTMKHDFCHQEILENILEAIISMDRVQDFATDENQIWFEIEQWKYKNPNSKAICFLVKNSEEKETCIMIHPDLNRRKIVELNKEQRDLLLRFLKDLYDTI